MCYLQFLLVRYLIYSLLESLSHIDFTEFTESNVLFTISFGEIFNLLIIKPVKSLRVSAIPIHVSLSQDFSDFRFDHRDLLSVIKLTIS